MRVMARTRSMPPMSTLPRWSVNTRASEFSRPMANLLVPRCDGGGEGHGLEAIGLRNPEPQAERDGGADGVRRRGVIRDWARAEAARWRRARAGPGGRRER